MTRNSRRALFVAAIGLSLAACGGAEGGAPVGAIPRRPLRQPRHRRPTPTPTPAPTPTPTPPPSGGMTFTERCAQPGVVKCVGFDSAADFSTGSGGTNGAYGFNSGIIPPSGTTDYTRATMDTAVKASGNGSLKFTIPSNSGSDTSGTYFTNFSSDLSVQFGENSEFFVQWRQRFSPEYISDPVHRRRRVEADHHRQWRPGSKQALCVLHRARNGGSEPLPKGLSEDVQLVHRVCLARAVRQLF